jgi:disulfide bond formation protein DsbB
MSVKSMSLFFAVLALACWAGTFAIVVVSLVRRFGRDDALEQVREDVGRIALPLAWLVAGVTMLGSLYYSKVQGYIPCELCWYQRICIYPWTVILAIAAWRRDTAIRIYAIPVLCISVVISIYHTWIMAYPPSSGTSFCTLAAPCTTRYVWEFGFVSLPFMALSAAVFMIALLSIAQPPFAADEIVEEVEVSA